MTDFSKTSAAMGGTPEVDQGQDPRPDTNPPVSGRTSRRKPEHITEALRLRDEVLALVEKEPRTETQIVELTGRSKGEVKAALRRLAVADLVFSRETGNAYRDAPLWHHWPTMIAGLRAKRDAQGPLRSAGQVVRATGMRVA